MQIITSKPTQASFALRNYQKKAISDTYHYFRIGVKSVLLYAPTGAGKTVISSKIIADSVGKGRRVLFLCHRTKLITQTVSTLKKFFSIDSGVIWGDHPQNPDAPVQIAMIQSIQNRELPKDIGLVIVDECHTTSYYKIFQRIINNYSNGCLPLSPCYFLGLTATPWRSRKKEGYCQFFQALVKAPHPGKLIELGHLTFARHFGWGGLIDFSQLETGSGGDYTQQSMQKVCNEEFNTTVVEKFLEVCPNRKSIAFCAGVVQAQDLAKQFNAVGIVSEVLTGEVEEGSREEIYARFKSGATQIITSVSCLCEGFDESSCDAAIIARPTKSRALLVQMSGRALRLHPGKNDAFLLDFCGNFHRLGISTKAYPISLCPSNKNDDFELTKECPECHAAVPSFAQICPECGYEFTQDGEGEEELGDNDSLEFGEILSDEQKKQLGYLRGQLRKAYKSGKNVGRVSFLFWRKYQFTPPDHWYKDAIFRRGRNPHPQQRKADEQIFLQFLKSTKKNAPKGWLGQMMRREFGYGWYNLEPIKWWEVLGVEMTSDWDVIKSAYQSKISVSEKSSAALLNFCLDEAREFCSVMSIKAV